MSFEDVYFHNFKNFKFILKMSFEKTYFIILKILNLNKKFLKETNSKLLKYYIESVL